MAILIGGILSGVASNAFALTLPAFPPHPSSLAAAEKIRQLAQDISSNPNIPDTPKSDIVGKLNGKALQLETGVGCSFLDPRGC